MMIQTLRKLRHDALRRGTTLTVALTLAAAFAAPATQAEDSDPASSKWRVRGRVIGIIPDDDSTNINLEPFGGAPVGLGAGVTVDSAVVPELDITYMITPHIGIEAIAGIANHDVKIDGNDPVLGGLGAVDGFKIFDVWVLPPTVTLQYHFMPSNKFRPYVGVGANYTAFLWNDATDKLETAVGGPVDVDTSSSWGWAA